MKETGVSVMTALAKERPSHHLIGIAFPPLEALRGVDVCKGVSHKDNYLHTLAVVDNIAEKTTHLGLRLAALLHDVGKPVTKAFDRVNLKWTFRKHENVGAAMLPAIFDEFALPDEYLPLVQKLVLMHMRPKGFVQTDRSVRRLMIEAGDDLDALFLLAFADVTTANPYHRTRAHGEISSLYEACKNAARIVNAESSRLKVSGVTIMEHTQLQPGPLVGKIKAIVEAALVEAGAAPAVVGTPVLEDDMIADMIGDMIATAFHACDLKGATPEEWFAWLWEKNLEKDPLRYMRSSKL